MNPEKSIFWMAKAGKLTVFIIINNKTNILTQFKCTTPLGNQKLDHS